MKIPMAVVCIMLSALITGEGWIASEIIGLKVSVARLESRLDARIAANPNAVANIAKP